MAINNKPLKAYVRFDGSGRIVAGSLILRKQKPKVGKWQEIPAYECCNYTTTTTTTASEYSFSVRRNNTGPCAASPFTTVYSNSSLLGPGISVYNDFALTSPISQFTHICDCVNNIDYTVLADNTLAPGVLSICITTTTTTTPAP